MEAILSGLSGRAGKQKTSRPGGTGGFGEHRYVVLAYIRRRRSRGGVGTMPGGYHAADVAGEWLVIWSLASGRSKTDWTASRPGPHNLSHTWR
jgi:hypothetical protein